MLGITDVALPWIEQVGQRLQIEGSDVLDTPTPTSGALKVRKGGGWYIDEPKTKAGDRVIPLTEHLVVELRAHRRRQTAEQLAATDWQDLGFVFFTTVDTPLTGRMIHRWWSAIFEPAVNERGDPLPDDEQPLGLDARPFHATRRTP